MTFGLFASYCVICVCPVFVERFQHLMAKNMKTAVFWDVEPCSLIDGYDVSDMLLKMIPT
jgi:Zn-finger protein